MLMHCPGIILSVNDVPMVRHCAARPVAAETCPAGTAAAATRLTTASARARVVFLNVFMGRTFPRDHFLGDHER
ncbi:hypothetical protein GCM10017778_67170 [Streptomyces vinaceus]|nr:hypothetical protein GCM10017778_67170 [Streptomyces vinaceus]